MNLFFQGTPEERRLKLEMEHAERMKALEVGRPTPEAELARCRAEEAMTKATAGRDIACAVFTSLAPVGVCGVAVGATAVVLKLADPATHAFLIAVVWVCSALVSVALIASGVLLSGRVRWRDLMPRPAPSEAPPHQRDMERLSEAFQR